MEIFVLFIAGMFLLGGGIILVLALRAKLKERPNEKTEDSPQQAAPAPKNVQVQKPAPVPQKQPHEIDKKECQKPLWYRLITSGDVSAFNKKRASFTADKCTLSGIRVKGLDLSEINLTKCKLTDCQFTKVNLTKSLLEQAILERCVFIDCCFEHGHWRNAKLSDCSITGGNAYGWALWSATVERTTFNDLKAGRFKLTNSHVDEAIINRCDLTEAEFYGTEFERSRFTECELNRTNISSCSGHLLLKDCQGKRTQLNNGDFDKLELINLTIEQAKLDHLKCSSFSVEKCELNQLSAECTTLPEANMPELDLSEANFRDSDLSRANLVGSKFVNAKLYGCDLTEAKLNRANFFKADLSRAKLSSLQEGQYICTQMSGANVGEQKMKTDHLEHSRNLVESCEVEDCEIPWKEMVIEGVDKKELLEHWKWFLPKYRAAFVTIHGFLLVRDRSPLMLHPATATLFQLGDTAKGYTAWLKKRRKGKQWEGKAWLPQVALALVERKDELADGQIFHFDEESNEWQPISAIEHFEKWGKRHLATFNDFVKND